MYPGVRRDAGGVFNSSQRSLIQPQKPGDSETECSIKQRGQILLLLDTQWAPSAARGTAGLHTGEMGAMSSDTILVQRDPGRLRHAADTGARPKWRQP